MNNLECIRSTDIGFWKLQRTEYKYQYEFVKKIHDMNWENSWILDEHWIVPHSCSADLTGGLVVST